MRLVALHCSALGSRLLGFIAVADGSVTALPAVLNGCSNLFGEIFEDRGVHTRAAVGVTSLPLGVPVEIDCIVQVEDE